MTDRLSLTNALADADIDRQKAERIATKIFDAIHDNVATKQDLHSLEAALKTDLQALERRTLLERARASPVGTLRQRHGGARRNRAGGDPVPAAQLTLPS